MATRATYSVSQSLQHSKERFRHACTSEITACVVAALVIRYTFPTFSCQTDIKSVASYKRSSQN